MVQKHESKSNTNDNAVAENVRLQGEFINVLNDAASLGKEEMMALIGTRVPCREAFETHPTIEVLKDIVSCRVGMLGILNGISRQMFNKTTIAEIDDTGGLRFFFKEWENHE
jgi:hypothetical protein